MRFLILGGTVFVGRHVAQAALDQGHSVTTFTRGRTNSRALLDVEPLIGDRDGDLRALETREWDAVVDTTGFVPRVVRLGLETLRDRVGMYVFISSIAVYPDRSRVADESYPVRRLADPADENIVLNYGALKAACETVVTRDFGANALIVRPGLIGGPWDPSGRVTYWPNRIADGGIVLAPEPRDAPVQFIDVRDLAAWIVRMCERNAGGIFNATGPVDSLSIADFFEICRTATDSDAQFAWVDSDILLRAGVEPWHELPLWWPEHPGKQQVDIRRALAADLVLRPTTETVRDVIAWTQEVGASPPRQDDGRYRARTLSRHREREILATLA